jgi:uncharacterized protein (DUF1330 family)
MPAYAVVELKLEDQGWIEGYVPPVRALIEKRGGRIIARAFEFEQLEGERRPDAIVLIEFPSMDAARAFYNDPDYQPHLKARLAGSRGELFLVPGE